MSVPSKVQVAWFAGLMEGEGSFTYDKRGKTTIRVEFTSTDEDIVNKVQKLFSAGAKSLYLSGGGRQWNAKPYWRVRWNGDNAANVIRLILPYLGKRRTDQCMRLLDRRDGKPQQYRLFNDAGPSTGFRKAGDSDRETLLAPESRH